MASHCLFFEDAIATIFYLNCVEPAAGMAPQHAPPRSVHHIHYTTRLRSSPKSLPCSVGYLHDRFVKMSPVNTALTTSTTLRFMYTTMPALHCQHVHIHRCELRVKAAVFICISSFPIRPDSFLPHVSCSIRKVPLISTVDLAHDS